MTTFTVKKSGYLAAAAAVTWASGTTLTSLASNGWTSLSDEIDNSTNKYALTDLYIELGSAAFTAGSYFEIYIVLSVDGTKYPTWTTGTADETENFNHFVTAVNTSGSTAAQKMAAANIPLPSGKFKFGFRNKGGVALPASGNTVYWRPHSVINTDV